VSHRNTQLPHSFIREVNLKMTINVIQEYHEVLM